MDLKISNKETRKQPDGAVEVLIDNVFDLYPVFDGDFITDVQLLDDEVQEMLNRAMFAAVRQRGQDPLDRAEGVQWAQAVAGEVPAPVVLAQVQNAVADENTGVKVHFYTERAGTREFLNFKLALAK